MTPQAAADARWMRHALALAETSLYITAPNPRVGCVIVRDEVILGQGATQQAGGPHAEVVALRDAAAKGHDTQGATVYVTLEPCNHHGRTPPCVDALISAKVGRVVIAMCDPNPLVGGQGLARLREAGIAVTLGVCAQEALALNVGFVSRMVRGLPWVWVKSGISLDGHTALPGGESQWITGPLARADGHQWRARSCVVLTGIGTVRSDNPRLNVREVDTPRQPIRAVIDARFEIDENAQLFDGEKIWLFVCRNDPAKAERLAQRNIEVVVMPSTSAGVDLPSIMRWLAAHQVNEVHVEAGARLSGALLETGSVDELLVYMAPLLLGQGRGMADMPAVPALDAAERFEFVEATVVGTDMRLRLRHPGHWAALTQALDRITQRHL
ncbi:bifunctional diaminohydroxyphosphoribosylaminopyrimidine deaminase/5-amino-6-(5-phosphoribosylamino)uracil reductase RibD [Achromobacter sp. F4_2707]|uniref:bifunctional diaminohydroxyphosphoribosylaminopyrimidine deaminase/5-amino-6-(5-phosphoribosylamino)uracil reductase RibD n=1 Tax=Achromobacter sp. F4_2707 TaxID=3114286 RepID=UPI0039C6424B